MEKSKQPKINKFEAAAQISAILSQLTKKEATDVLKMVGAVYDFHLTSNFTPAAPSGPPSGRGRGGVTTPRGGKGNAQPPRQSKPKTREVKALEAQLELVKDKIRAEVKAQGSSNLDSEHPLVFERDSLLGALKKAREGSSSLRNSGTSSDSEKKAKPSKKKDPSTEDAKDTSITSPPRPKDGGGDAGKAPT